MTRLVEITNALFKKHGSKLSPLIFQKPITFSIDKHQNWLVVGPEKSKFLEVLSGKYLSQPALSRRLSPKIKLLSFQDKLGISDAHLSARYESLASVESVNSTVADFIYGSYNYNQNNRASLDMKYVDSLVERFNLTSLLSSWVNTLSNGQTRRLKFVRSLVDKPELLIVDDPYLGLDPTNTKLISGILSQLSKDLGITLVLGLRGNDVTYNKDDYNSKVILAERTGITLINRNEISSADNHSRELRPAKLQDVAQPHIEFADASIQYQDRTIIDKLNLKIPKSTNWRIMGNNGSGKTTLLSIITCDHPQSWKSLITIDGVTRKSGTGLSFFNINNKIGISSPELHALVPSNKTMKQVILNGLIPNIGNSNFSLTFKGSQPDFATRLLHEFHDILHTYGDTHFRELSATNQKLALFLRAILKKPEILILDEAFSCFDDIALLQHCHAVLQDYLPETTVLMIAHVDWELPHYEYALKLNDDRSHTIYEVC